MAKSIKLKNNNYWDSKGIVFTKQNLYDLLIEQPKCFNTYNIAGGNQYIIIDTKSTNLFEMIHLKVVGNGYGLNPIDSVIQAYHYQPLGYFLNYKILNKGCPLSAWIILDGTIKIVIQVPADYMSFSIMLWLPIHKEQAFKSTISGVGTFPSTCTHSVQCVSV